MPNQIDSFQTCTKLPSAEYATTSFRSRRSRGITPLLTRCRSPSRYLLANLLRLEEQKSCFGRGFAAVRASLRSVPAAGVSRAPAGSSATPSVGARVGRAPFPRTRRVWERSPSSPQRTGGG